MPITRITSKLLMSLMIIPTFTVHSSLAGGAISATAFKQATASAHGLEMAVRIKSGQYFLGEMLSARILVSNHSSKRISFEGAVLPSTCERSPFIAVMGGSAPHYQLPWASPFSCPNEASYQINPGQTRTATLLVVLQASGRLRLTAQTSYERRVSPFGDAWPSIDITVIAHAPPQRVLHLRRHGSIVFVTVQQGHLPHLLYQYLIISGGTRTGTRDWEPLAGTSLHDPRGALASAEWRVLVTAPGYVVASANYN